MLSPGALHDDDGDAERPLVLCALYEYTTTAAAGMMPDAMMAFRSFSDRMKRRPINFDPLTKQHRWAIKMQMRLEKSLTYKLEYLNDPS